MKTTKNILIALVVGAPLIFASSGASGAPATGGFGPVSVSFVSPSQGFVLGTSPCAHAPCTSVLTTGNGGTSWSVRAALPASVPDPAASEPPSGVSEITFANPSDGWVFGPLLWATTNGGAAWHQKKLGGPVLSLTAAGGYVYAVVASCYETSGSCSPFKARALTGTTKRVARRGRHFRPWDPGPARFTGRVGVGGTVAVLGRAGIGVDHLRRDIVAP